MPSRETMASLVGRYHGMAQDIDSVKHILRGVQWRLDALVAHLGLKLQPDALEPVIFPSQQSINETILAARGDFLKANQKRARKRRVVRKKRG